MHSPLSWAHVQFAIKEHYGEMTPLYDMLSNEDTKQGCSLLSFVTRLEIALPDLPSWDPWGVKYTGLEDRCQREGFGPLHNFLLHSRKLLTLKLKLSGQPIAPVSSNLRVVSLSHCQLLDGAQFKRMLHLSTLELNSVRSPSPLILPPSITNLTLRAMSTALICLPAPRLLPHFIWTEMTQVMQAFQTSLSRPYYPA